MTAPPASREGQSGRTYRVPANGGFIDVPSVTNVLGVMAKPALVNSAVKITADRAVTHYIALGELIRKEGPDKAATFLKAFHKDEWGAKRDIGTAVHHAIHQELIGMDPEAAWATDLAGHRRSWEAFKTDYAPTFELAEATVFSLKPGHAGTLDSLFVIGRGKYKGKRTLCDTKSGGIFLEAQVQVAAYRHSPFILMPDGSVEPMPSVDFGSVLQLTGTGARLLEVAADEVGYRAFLYLLALWNYQKDQPREIGTEVPK